MAKQNLNVVQDGDLWKVFVIATGQEQHIWLDRVDATNNHRELDVIASVTNDDETSARIYLQRLPATSKCDQRIVINEMPGVEVEIVSQCPITNAYLLDNEQETIIPDYLSLTAEDDEIEFSLEAYVEGYNTGLPNIQYSSDGKLWFDFVFDLIFGDEYSGSYSSQYLYLGKNETVYLRGNNPNGISFRSKFGEGIYRDVSFHIYGDTKADGDLNTLIDTKGGDIALPVGCFGSLFEDCDITSSPRLPSTSLSDKCYIRLFAGSKIEQGPNLPATEMKYKCYYEMFMDCHLMTAPVSLIADIVADNCYTEIYRDCEFAMSDDEETLNFTFGAELPFTVRMTDGETGTDITKTLTNVIDIADWLGNRNGLPEYLCFTASEPSTVSIYNSGYRDLIIEYSADKKNWTQLSFVDGQSDIISLATGESVYMRGSNPNGTAYYNDPWRPATFVMTGQLEASGDVFSLIDGVGGPYAGITESADWGLGGLCGLFKDCVAMTTPPKLGPKYVGYEWYKGIYYGCSGLTRNPEFPALMLGEYCYEDALYGSGVTALKLPAEYLEYGCYMGMCRECGNLSRIEVGASEWIDMPNWVDGVAAEGTFIKPAYTDIPEGTDGIPEGWTVVEID